MSEYQPLGARKGARKGPKNGFHPLKILFWPRLDVGSSLGIKIHILTNFHDFSLKNGRDSFSRTSDAYVNLSLFSERFSRPPPPLVESRAHLLVRTSGPSDRAGRPFGPAATVVGPSKRGLLRA